MAVLAVFPKSMSWLCCSSSLHIFHMVCTPPSFNMSMPVSFAVPLLCLAGDGVVVRNGEWTRTWGVQGDWQLPAVSCTSDACFLRLFCNCQLTNATCPAADPLTTFGDCGSNYPTCGHPTHAAATAAALAAVKPVVYYHKGDCSSSWVCCGCGYGMA